MGSELACHLLAGEQEVVAVVPAANIDTGAYPKGPC